MPMPFQTKIDQRQDVSAIAERAPVQSQVMGRQIEARPSHMPDFEDPDLKGLVTGLSQFSPALGAMVTKAEEDGAVQGATDRLTGQEPKSWQTKTYEDNYFKVDGMVKAQQDGAALTQWYSTEFDKDSTPQDLDNALRQKYADMTQGLHPDAAFMQGYGPALSPTLIKLREAHLDYLNKQQEGKVESNFMQMMDQGFQSYLKGDPVRDPNTGEVVPGTRQPPPQDYLEGLRQFGMQRFGISSGRFDELMVETARRNAEKGYMDAWDVVKAPRPDGSASIYDNPAYSAKIDQLMQHSQEVSDHNIKRDRDERQDAALFQVFSLLYSDDPQGEAKSRALLDQYKAAGLFTRASDLIKWEKLYSEARDRAARPDQEEAGTTMLAGIYTGKAGIRDILGSDLTWKQKNTLLTTLRTKQQEDRMLAAQTTEKAIYKSPEFRNGEKYLSGVLSSQPSALDPMGVGTQFERQQLASAQLEYAQRAQGVKTPAELNAVREEIATRYLGQRKQFNDAQKQNGAGQLRFSSLKDARQAYLDGRLGGYEFSRQVSIFEQWAQPK